MSHEVKEFGDTARGLAKNPLGIIALFIVLVYGFAASSRRFPDRCQRLNACR